MTPTRPILRYHGGKFLLAPWILSHFPPHRVYVEPYGGAASVLLSKPRSYAEVYNDLDGEIVNLFDVLRSDPRRLMRDVAYTPFSRDEYRLSFERTNDPVEQARRTLIRSHMGFGSNALNRAIKSGFRGNATRSGTVPATDWAGLPPNVRHVARRWRGVVVENAPALEVIDRYDTPDTLYYLDPPYVHATRAIDRMHGNHGYAHEMTDADHRALADRARGVRGMIVLSGYHGELYDELYGDWETRERDTHADGAADRVEVLWLNPAASKALADGGLFGVPA